jgi:hypothetical protein
VGKTHGKNCQHPGKAPWGPWKEFQDRPATERVLRDKWHDLPNANVGLALGPVSGLVRVDVDGPAGEEKLQQLSGGDLPPTLEFTSGRENGGRGLLYRIPEGARLRTTSEREGVKQELRFQAKGSQTVLPPSRHHSGSLYAWVAGHAPGEIEAAYAPQWLLRELAPGKPSNGHAAALAEGERIPEGGRHTRLVSLGGTMRRRGMGQAAIEAALLAENQERCDPPLDDSEVCGIANRLTQYEPAEEPQRIKDPNGQPEYRWNPFPIQELPEPARSYAAAAARAIGCDPVFVVSPLLAGLSAAVGNSRRVKLKRTWSEPALLWTVSVAESGDLKSPPAEEALKPIMARQNEAIRKYEREQRTFENDQVVYEAEVADWKRKKSEERGPPPKRPERIICERFWCSDITVEALGRLLPRHLGACCSFATNLPAGSSLSMPTSTAAAAM